MGILSRLERLEAFEQEQEARRLEGMSDAELDALLDRVEAEYGLPPRPDVTAMGDVELQEYCEYLRADGDPSVWPNSSRQ